MESHAANQFPPDSAPQYKSLAVVGGKIYHSLMEQCEYREPCEPFHPIFRQFRLKYHEQGRCLRAGSDKVE